MAEVQNRLAREVDTRETTQRNQQWKPAQLLPDPKPEAGYGFRWIDRKSTRLNSSHMSESRMPSSA